MPDLFISPKENMQPTEESQKKLDPTQHKDYSFFHAYCSNPTNVTFANQEPGEHVVLLIRAHFITNIPWISTTLILLLLPLLGLLLFPVLGISIAFIPQAFLIIFCSFYLLMVFGYAFLSFVTWYYNLGIITPRRLIDIDFTDIRIRDVAETRIRGVVDVEFKQQGFLHSFFDFGDVYIQTEGVKPNFEFLSAPHPSKVVDLILDLKEQAKQ